MALVDTSERERCYVPHEASDPPDLEHDPWIEFRPLTGPEVRRASDSQSAGTIKRYQDALGALTSMRDDRTAEEKDEARRDPEQAKQQFDPDVLIPLAVVGWSYSEAVTPDAVKRLDATTEAWAWRIVWEQNIRPPTSESDSSPNSNSLSAMTVGLSRENSATPGSSSERESASATPSTSSESPTG